MREPGFYDDIPEETYHADPTSLSVSGAKLLLKAAALYKYRQENPEHKDVYDVGTSFHTKTLGVGPVDHVVDAASWRGKAAQEEQAKAREAGENPILIEDDKVTTEMAAAVAAAPDAKPWLQGQPEVSAYAPDPETGIMRRCRFDILGDHHIGDLKSCRDASPQGFAKDAAAFLYFMQAAWYLDVAADLGHPALGFCFIAVEKTPPYLHGIYELDADALDAGRALNRRALDFYAYCLDADFWPAYTNDPAGPGYQTLSLPGWIYKEHDL